MNDKMISPSRATIIIAAYNEAKIVRNTLSALCANKGLESYQILVVCNGCTDNTEQIVRDEFEQVHCCSLAEPSKALAIRYAESLNPGFPRLYLDADIELAAENAQRLINQIDNDSSGQLIIPSSKIIDKESSELVKSFYRYWYRTPYVRQAGYGAGTYLIDKAGRQRFGLWPELTADDAFIRNQFTVDEMYIDRSVQVAVRAPKTIWSLIKVKARSKFGNLELRAHENYSAHSPSVQNSNNSEEETKQYSPESKWYDPMIYGFVNTISLCIAKWRFIRGNKQWLRDDSNR